mmetsp:Transcript_7207/g.24119  ORF Transcript_7207/g.24119 Transcript_7207/m.24119 type:complete len:219 (+) Transcript_7207:1075-1731(+)
MPTPRRFEKGNSPRNCQPRRFRFRFHPNAPRPPRVVVRGRASPCPPPRSRPHPGSGRTAGALISVTGDRRFSGARETRLAASPRTSPGNRRLRFPVCRYPRAPQPRAGTRQRDPHRALRTRTPPGEGRAGSVQDSPWFEVHRKANPNLPRTRRRLTFQSSRVRRAKKQRPKRRRRQTRKTRRRRRLGLCVSPLEGAHHRAVSRLSLECAVGGTCEAHP